MYATKTTPVIQLMTCAGVKAIREALVDLQQDLVDSAARYKALYGSWLYGMCLEAADMVLHHKLCHTLGGAFNLLHAETHVIMLPYVVAFNAPRAPRAHEAMQQLAGAIADGRGDAVRGLNTLHCRLGIDLSLESLGMPENGTHKAVKIALTSLYANPRFVEQVSMRELLGNAWKGAKASSSA